MDPKDKRTIGSTETMEVSKWATREAFFFNHGADIACWTLYIALNVAMSVWAIWEFTPPHWTTDSDILRITLPIARAGGRLVTFNAAIILITGSKWLWTMIRQYTVIPLGFPVDEIMPHYHRIIAWNIILGGCIVHTIPQVINYATGEIKIVDNAPIWTWGDGFSSKQLLVTGILLWVIFVMFFLTTLQKVRHTSIGFRLFWVFHVVGITLAFPLLLIHGTMRGHPITLYFLIVPLGIYAADCIIRRFLFVEREAKVVEWSTHEDQGEQVTKLVLDCKYLEYTPGQYAELKIPEISHYEWHPFTIASAPERRSTKVIFFIKGSGRWTNRLFEIVSTSSGDSHRESVSVLLRGPHGAPAQNYLMYRHLVVIGSGIGVTPLLSIWQYLINEGFKLVNDTASKNVKAKEKNKNLDSQEDPGLPSAALEDETELLVRLASQNINSVDVCVFEKTPLSTLKGRCAYWSSVMESMTVNIWLFCTSVTLETIVFSIWLYEQVKIAAILQVVASCLALVIFGSKIALSLIAYGPERYCRSLVCLLECCIVLLDLGSVVSSLMTIGSPSKKEAIAYFSFFAFFLILHGVRIFHIFYATATPPNDDSYAQTLAENGKIHSITGIWVSRLFSSMSFAAGDLVTTLEKASPVFSMTFFGTREKGADTENGRHSVRAGRPDWSAIFQNEITSAHATNPEGEAVGVFFCGSPAIARDLQRNAQLVTAQHQHVIKSQTGKTCRCRILVHKENF